MKLMTGIRRQAAQIAATVILLTAAPVGNAIAESAKCGGKDMLAELASTEPEAYRRIRAEAKATINTEALLWRVERDGVAPSYLFGTIHLTDKRVTKFSPRLEAALAEAKTVALEVADLSPAAMTSAMMQAPKLVMFTDGRRLDGMLSAEEFDKVKSTLGAVGMPTEVAPLFRPWIVYMILSVSGCERKKVESGDKVLDMRVAEAAKLRGVPVVGLETVEEQLNAMASVPDDQQVEMLRATLKYAARSDDLMETVVKLYVERNMGAAWPFQIMLAKNAGVDPAPLAVFQEKLVNARNRKMRDGALPLLEKGGAIVAVGALHLPGETGLVKLIRDAGYTVTPVE